MQLRLRTSKKSVYVTLSVLLVYWFLLKKRRYTETFQVTIDSVEPKTAWEYIADFSNQMKLNPTMEEFEIVYEKGNYALWEYSVTYKEHFAKIPFFHNDNTAIFRVTPEIRKGHYEPYRIDSEHHTCILFYCLQTDAEITFEAGKDRQTTVMQERVTYECPPLLSPVCKLELKTQKKLIYEKILAVDMNMPF
ncbi:unnamed protein product [Allacma fusca]|uniref:Uncharacterized protein n=1 Tax=Allacma fusca TaxID=39272 RepID=A0A8J2JYP0_9HEXA|nr:unnamed protein product [Allacma fusca]